MELDADRIQYYASPGPMTDAGRYSGFFDGVPEDIASLCEIVQNNLLHIFWAERYGVVLNEQQKQMVNVRPVADKLHAMSLAGSVLLTTGKGVSSRQVGNCRDFSLLLTAMLRHQRRPARARCGFGAYFLPGHYEDHWVCEYWNAEQGRWMLVDAQLDSLQRKILEIQFDPLDVPRDQFITGGHAWQMCRRGEANPDQFGIFDMHGWWFIWGDVMRDFYALNKIEILPWDGGWGFLTHGLDEPLADEAELGDYDRIASLCVDPDGAFSQIRSVFKSDTRFCLPPEFGPLV